VRAHIFIYNVVRLVNHPSLTTPQELS
jgi:hypothetical protein